jgi:hypothetical protein
VGLAITVLPATVRASQGQKPPKGDADSRTVTLAIEGMT